MEKFISIIKEFEGIIGALLGVIITMLMNEYLKEKGNIKYYFDNLTINYKARGNYGNYMDVDKGEDYEGVEYRLDIQLYNTSESRKILRDIKLQFIGSEGTIEDIPKDRSTERVSGGISIRDSLKIININPKEIVEIKVGGSFYHFNCDDINDIKKLNNIEKIYMMAKDSNDKKVKKLIKDYTKTS